MSEPSIGTQQDATISMDASDAQAPRATGTVNDRTYVIVTYALYLSAPLFLITPLIALIIGYVQRSKAGPIHASHYHFQIRSFWISTLMGLGLLLATIIGTMLMVIGIGFLISGAAYLAMLVLAIWYYVRMIVGLVRAINHEPITNPRSWMV